MKNLKKVLALVVAVAMFASFACVASAASYSDVASTASYADAVNLLSNLGILTGYEDGTFRPDNTVTRAEAATMMVRLLGLADGVEQGETSFTDVDANHWASGYINVAVAQGIVNGMGDGTFAPDATLTYGQIVKMIVCALGYEPVAKANGGWLGGGYLYAASKAGFTKGVNGTQDAAASRATVAVLMYKALEVDMMEQDSYSTGISGDTFKVIEGKTILTEYLELEKVEGVIVETYLSNVDDFEEDANTVEIVITKNDSEDVTYEVGEKYSVISDATNAATLLGYSVVAYIGENEDGDDEIFAVAAKSGKNNVVVLDTDLIAENGLTATSITYYKSSTSKSTTEAEIQAYVGKNEEDGFATNNVVINGFNVYANAVDLFDVYEALDDITLLDNDNDGDFEFIFATIPTANALEFVVTDVDYEEYFIEGEDEDFEVDYDDTDRLFTIVKDGAIVELDAVVENDVVTILDTDAKIVTIYVSSKVVNGTVDEVDDDVYTINGVDYKLTAIADVDAPEAGDEGLFYINASGKIAYIDAESTISAADYVYVIDTDVSNGDFGDDSYLVKVVTAKGEIEVLTIKSKKVTVYNEDGQNKNLDDDEAYEKIDGYVGLAKIDTTAAGELSVIYLPGAEDFVADNTYVDVNNKSYNEARGTYGVIDLASDVLVFNVDTTEADLEDAITASTVANIFVDDNSYKFVAYGEEDEDPDVLVTFDAKAAVDAEAPVMVVTKVVKATSGDDTTWKITGIVAGETVSVVLDPDDADLSDMPAVKGNVILYAMNSGFATDLQVLFTSDEDAPGALGTGLDDILTDEFSEDDVTIHYGTIEDVQTKSFTVDGTKFYLADEYNVTVVDYTGANVSIAKGSKSSIKADTDKYARTAFVKTVSDAEDEVSDVVVFVVAK